MTKPKLSPFALGQLAVLIFALLLRLINLSGSFWLDEAAQALESARPLSEQLNIINDFQPPFYHYLVHFWMILGTSEWYLRLTSLIPGLITVWLTIGLGKRLFNRGVGLTAGILLATSEFHVFYSQELRPYSLAAMWAMMAAIAYYDLLKHQKYAAPVLVLASLAGLYTTYLFPLFLITLLVITFIWHRVDLKQIVLLLLAAGLLWLPWLPMFLKQITVGTSYASAVPLWSHIVSAPLWKMLPLVVAKFLVGRVNVDFALPDLLFVGSLAALSVFLINRALKFSKTKEVLVWLILPVLLALLISIKIPVLDPKRVLFCLPALYLVLAAGIGKGYKSALALIILLSVNMLSLNRYAADPVDQREPWRKAVADIEEVAAPSDKVIFTFSAPFAPWTWYQTKQLGTISIENPPAELTDATQLEQKLTDTESVFVFDYLHEFTDPNNVLLKNLALIGFKETGFVQYPNLGKVHLLQKTIPAVAAILR